MSLIKIAYRSIQHRSLASALTALSMSLGVALIVTVIVIHGVISDSFNRSAQGYDLIIGPKQGSALEIVLSTVFYLRTPTGTVPSAWLPELRTGKYSHLVEHAIPVAIGHHYRNCPIVGTNPGFFEYLRYRGDHKYETAEGQWFDVDDTFTAVLGSRAKQRSNLRIGDEFIPVAEGEGDEQHKPFKIVGCLKPTGTPNDNAIFVNINGFYNMHEEHEHDEHEHGEEHEADSEHEHDNNYSAILVLTKQRQSGMPMDENDISDPEAVIRAANNMRMQTDLEAMSLQAEVDKSLDAQAVSPIREVALLFENMIGNIQMLLVIMAALIVCVAGIGMMVSIYNSMNERRQEIAVMRALGARRLTVMGIILLESILLSLGGGVLGVFFGHLLVGALSPSIMEYTGIAVSIWQFKWAELILIPALVMLASVVGYIPALVAYKQDVATSLLP
jgi:putative ABC transport system permease protein